MAEYIATFLVCDPPIFQKAVQKQVGEQG